MSFWLVGSYCGHCLLVCGSMLHTDKPNLRIFCFKCGLILHMKISLLVTRSLLLHVLRKHLYNVICGSGRAYTDDVIMSSRSSHGAFTCSLHSYKRKPVLQTGSWVWKAKAFIRQGGLTKYTGHDISLIFNYTSSNLCLSLPTFWKLNSKSLMCWYKFSIHYLKYIYSWH